MSSRPVEILNLYFTSLSEMRTGEDLAKFFHPEIIHTEYPNRLSDKVIVRNLNEMLVGAEKGVHIFSQQSYEVQKYICNADDVVAEVLWRGVVKVPLSTLNAGDEMVAYLACIFEFKDGLIYRQRNYDCFENFE